MIAYVLFRIGVALVARIPFSALYVLSDGLVFLLRRVFAYRRETVRANLRRCFPEWSAEELSRTEKGFYRNLSDVLLEGIKGLGLPKGALIDRWRVVNPEVATGYGAEGRSVVCMPGHLANWEWSLYTCGFVSDLPVVAVYKPLRNARINAWLRNRVQPFNVELASIKETTATFDRYAQRPTLYILASDQSPSNVRDAIRADFFGEKLLWLHGAERHARRFDWPVYFAGVKRTGRGHYELTLELLADRPSELPPGELTALYAQKMEKAIREKPTDWLWSHKRWKRSAEDGRLLEGR
jgi:KDO2-lipid IV(A) lauroyltransferase